MRHPLPASTDYTLADAAVVAALSRPCRTPDAQRGREVSIKGGRAGAGHEADSHESLFGRHQILSIGRRTVPSGSLEMSIYLVGDRRCSRARLRRTDPFVRRFAAALFAFDALILCVCLSLRPIGLHLLCGNAHRAASA